MKKFILMMALMFSAVMGANAQTALETQKLFDNTSIGVVVGATTPLDFNSVFPLNTVAGLKLGKDFTPVFGVEAEGLAILNDNHFADIKTVVKATNVGLNGVTNLSNLFGDYTGAPRAFEVKTVAGLGWLYLWNTNVHDLTAKTGPIQFNKNHAQLGLTASLVYHFKTSNGTNNFKLYDVGAMNAEINNLRAELAKKPTEVIRDHFVEKIVEKNVGNNEWVVFFAKNSAELTAEAKKALDKIPAGSTVGITATASPEGTEERNNALSEDRAEVVAKYLDARGLKIGSVKGLGVQGEASNRVAIVVTK